MKINWTVEASAELDHMLAYIAARDAGAARLIAERVFRIEKRIARFPKAARYDIETGTYDLFVPKTRIILTYAVRGDIIWIITAWHTSRDPAAKSSRS